MSPPLVLSFPLGRDLQRSQHTSFLNNTWDPNTSLVLKIKLLGNYKKSRQDVKCFSIDMVVDSDTTNYMDLVESVVEKYLPGYLEVAHIQYYDEGLKSFPEVKIDQELMSMFDKHLKRRVVILFVVYRGHSDPYEPVT